MHMWKLGMMVVAFAMVGLVGADVARGDTFDVTLKDGSRVRGSLRTDAVKVQTPYGRLTVPLQHVISLAFGTQDNTDELRAVHMAIIGRAETKEFIVRTETLGDVRLAREHLLRIERVGGPHRFLGSWAGTAADKPGQGRSKDRLTIHLKMDAAGRVQGVARGRFVLNEECKLENLEITGDTLAFELLHRDERLVRVELELAGDQLKGEGWSPDAGYDVSLERRSDEAKRRVGPARTDEPHGLELDFGRRRLR